MSTKRVKRTAYGAVGDAHLGNTESESGGSIFGHNPKTPGDTRRASESRPDFGHVSNAHNDPELDSDAAPDLPGGYTKSQAALISTLGTLSELYEGDRQLRENEIRQDHAMRMNEIQARLNRGLISQEEFDTLKAPIKARLHEYSGSRKKWKEKSKQWDMRVKAQKWVPDLPRRFDFDNEEPGSKALRAKRNAQALFPDMVFKPISDDSTFQSWSSDSDCGSQGTQSDLAEPDRKKEGTRHTSNTTASDAPQAKPNKKTKRRESQSASSGASRTKATKSSSAAQSPSAIPEQGDDASIPQSIDMARLPLPERLLIDPMTAAKPVVAWRVLRKAKAERARLEDKMKRWGGTGEIGSAGEAGGRSGSRGKRTGAKQLLTTIPGASPDKEDVYQKWYHESSANPVAPGDSLTDAESHEVAEISDTKRVKKLKAALAAQEAQEAQAGASQVKKKLRKLKSQPHLAKEPDTQGNPSPTAAKKARKSASVTKLRSSYTAAPGDVSPQNNDVAKSHSALQLRQKPKATAPARPESPSVVVPVKVRGDKSLGKAKSLAGSKVTRKPRSATKADARAGAATE